MSDPGPFTLDHEPDAERIQALADQLMVAEPAQEPHWTQQVDNRKARRVREAWERAQRRKERDHG